MHTLGLMASAFLYCSHRYGQCRIIEEPSRTQASLKPNHEAFNLLIIPDDTLLPIFLMQAD